MQTIHDFREVKIRKPQQCSLCMRLFPVNTVLWIGVFADSGQAYNVYNCPACMEIIGILRDDFDYDMEEIPEGFVMNEMNQDSFEGSPEEYIKHLEIIVEKGKS